MRRSLRHHLLSFAIALVLLVGAAASARADGGLVRFVLGREGGKADAPDTTALREEYKVTVSHKDAERFRRRLEKIGGSSFSLRDQQPHDGRNVTSTDYLAVDGKALAEIVGLPRERPEISIAPKIRLRKYEVARHDGGRRASQPGLTWVEIKLPHPEIGGVTMKPRILASDDAVLRLRDPRVMRDPAARAVLRDELIALAGQHGEPSARAVREIDHILGVFVELHRRGSFTRDGDGRIATEVNIRYQRDAYELPVEIGGKPVRLQFTFDRAIEFRDVGAAGVRALRSAPVVVEIKIPMPYAQMSRGALERAIHALGRASKDQARHGDLEAARSSERSRAGFEAILAVREHQERKLEPRQIDGFATWKGKHFTFRNLEHELAPMEPAREAEADRPFVLRDFLRERSATRRTEREGPPPRELFGGRRFDDTARDRVRDAGREDLRAARSAEP